MGHLGNARMMLYSLLTLLVLGSGGARARDEFGAMGCGADVPAALIGQKGGNEPVARIEARHRNLGLKDLGGDEISDDLNSVSWLICGKEYVVLYNKDGIVRDVLPMPPHSRNSPAFSGACRRAGKKVAGIVIGVLERIPGNDGTFHDSRGDNTLLPARTVWRIDERQQKFVSLSPAGLGCPRSGIFTADGGP